MKLRIEREQITQSATISWVIEIEDTIAAATAMDIAVEAMSAMTGAKAQGMLEFTKVGIPVGVDKLRNQE